jgi:hypothetical protein
MATYEELFTITVDTEAALSQKITLAILIKAQEIVDDPSSTTPLLTWAREALRDPRKSYDPVFNYLLVKHKTWTTKNISQASDKVVQESVDDIVDKLLGA